MLDTIPNKDEAIADMVGALNTIAYQMAELARIKEELEARVSAMLEHGDDGSQTYTVGKFKVTCTAGYIYSVDKEEYEIMHARLPGRFNPVTIKQTYHLDKQIIRDAERFCSADEKALFDTMFSKKPSKLNVKVRAAV